MKRELQYITESIFNSSWTIGEVGEDGSIDEEISMIPRDIAELAEVESVEWEVFIEVILEFGQDSYGVCVAGSILTEIEYESEELVLEIFSLWAEFGKAGFVPVGKVVPTVGSIQVVPGSGIVP
jgi:hypothetical protein